jgi:hypothetical protein
VIILGEVIAVLQPHAWAHLRSTDYVSATLPGPHRFVSNPSVAPGEYPHLQMLAGHRGFRVLAAWLECEGLLT